MRKSLDIVNHSPRTGTAHGRPDAAQDDVLELVHRVMHQYRAQQYQVLRDGPHQITHMESKVLGYFGRHPGATQSDLAGDSGRDKAQLARLVKGLRERGLLDGTPDPADRRNTRLTLTAEGQALLGTLKQQAQRLAGKAVVGMSPQEQAQLLALLQRVRSNLDAPD
ncbi:MarR family winged helix-turn-helix transcriptional regulator [Paucibacter sp. M5-1]|uniref:MarR family winged helix-turn-helix transcriptional regulator n=1 Tax=Paucibacter sp. M5-1 TaxID=3015998 RepID=UPI0022B866F7|nr:MarR family winged helix-turn-helix transcriptional regulator [Paucibacter sp. M5-1]MCZ7882606.1 MarR family winged helix-turn-helix transcriptional regulator [Paucibacter sp. M5-1]